MCELRAPTVPGEPPEWICGDGVAKKNWPANWPTIGAPVTSVIPAPPTSRADRAIARERIAPSPRSEDDET